MILYDTKDWKDTFLKVIVSFYSSNNYRRLLKFIFAATLYAAALTVVNIEWAEIKFHLDPTFFSMLGIILSLVLVFRLNSAYNKWWEGRTQWGALVNNCRNLASYANAVIDEEDVDRRQYFASQISNFAVALKSHLRDQKTYEDLDLRYGAASRIDLNSGHIPHKIASDLYTRLHAMHKNQLITEIDKRNFKTHIENLIDILGACERIRNTPIPYSHSSFIKISLVAYTLALPFGLMNSFMYLTIPITALLTFALFGIEIISEEIEEPFSSDPNDLPLVFMSELIRTNVYDILEVEMPENVNSSESHPHKKLTIRK